MNNNQNFNFLAHRKKRTRNQYGTSVTLPSTTQVSQKSVIPTVNLAALEFSNVDFQNRNCETNTSTEDLIYSRNSKNNTNTVINGGGSLKIRKKFMNISTPSSPRR